mmetsp:Transcript_17242/g.34964  ORF Transcript_17242/g.34964 Transcript_17242/m.34964 type:complete len:293 (-) Transcript_17242:274-1152(-)
MFFTTFFFRISACLRINSSGLSSTNSSSTAPSTSPSRNTRLTTSVIFLRLVSSRRLLTFSRSANTPFSYSLILFPCLSASGCCSSLTGMIFFGKECLTGVTLTGLAAAAEASVLAFKIQVSPPRLYWLCELAVLNERPCGLRIGDTVRLESWRCKLLGLLVTFGVLLLLMLLMGAVAAVVSLFWSKLVSTCSGSSGCSSSSATSVSPKHTPASFNCVSSLGFSKQNPSEGETSSALSSLLLISLLSISFLSSAGGTIGVSSGSSNINRTSTLLSTRFSFKEAENSLDSSITE